MSFRSQSQILAIASLSSPQFNANPISAASGNVPVFAGFGSLACASRWRRACGYGNLPDIRIKFFRWSALR
jgi:hypothetical protein